MTRNSKFAATSAAWLALFFALGTHGADMEFGFWMAVVTYLVPFGGLWCSAALAYFE